MSPAEGIRDILVACDVLGGATGWAWEIGAIRDTAKSVAIIDSGGREGEVKVAIDYPSVQLIIQGEKLTGGYSVAWDKASEIYKLLHGIDTPNQTWSELTSCVAMGYITSLGRDDSDRPRFSLNFRLITTPEDVGDRTY